MNIRRHLSENLSLSQKYRIKPLLCLLTGDKLRYGPACNLRRGCRLPYRVLVGTHHKTGTNWLHPIFEAICHYHSLTFYDGKQESAPEQCDVFFENHSSFALDSLDEPFRGVHLIRDPRDVIVSACFYHQKSKEEWLHRPMKDLSGLTYQQKINSYSSIDDQMLFEMENSSKNNINDMLNWDYTISSFYDLKYEELIEDTNLILFHKVFTFLGFPGSVIPSLLAIAHNKSLFSEQRTTSAHVRSGKVNQWKRYFKPIHKDRFLEFFGDGLIRLGYEKDDNWATASTEQIQGRKERT